MDPDPGPKTYGSGSATLLLTYCYIIIQAWQPPWSWPWCRRTSPTWRSWTLSGARSSSCKSSAMSAGRSIPNIKSVFVIVMEKFPHIEQVVWVKTSGSVTFLRTDSDPRLRTTGLRFRILRLFFRGLQNANKYKFFSPCFLLITIYGTYRGYIYISLQRQKVVINLRTIEIKVFLNFFSCGREDPDPGGP